MNERTHKMYAVFHSLIILLHGSALLQGNWTMPVHRLILPTPSYSNYPGPMYGFVNNLNLQQGQFNPIPVINHLPTAFNPPTQPLPPPPPPPSPASGYCILQFFHGLANFFSALSWSNAYNNQYQYDASSGQYYDPSSYQSNSDLSYQDSAYENSQSGNAGTDYSFLEQGWSTGGDSNSNSDWSTDSVESYSSSYGGDERRSRPKREISSPGREITIVEVDFNALTYTIILTSMLVIQVGSLAAFGQPLVSRTGEVKFWDGDILSAENSQQLTDWYTFTHFIHGFIFYEILYLLAPNSHVAVRFIVALSLEVTWEIIENTPAVINRYRKTALAQGYVGDSIINSVADSVAMVLGFWIAEKLPGIVIIALTIIEELVLAAVIRDNLTLSILSIVWPMGKIRDWQEQGRRKSIPKPQLTGDYMSRYRVIRLH